jgi:hypothetical protein
MQRADQQRHGYPKLFACEACKPFLHRSDIPALKAWCKALQVLGKFV